MGGGGGIRVHHGGGGGMPPDINSIFENLFHMQQQQHHHHPNIQVFHNGVPVSVAPQKPQPIVNNINITLEQAYAGFIIQLELERRVFVSGVEQVEVESIPIQINKGISHGERIVLSEMGNRSPQNIKGDIHIIVDIVKHTYLSFLHLSSFKTPTPWAEMSEERRTDCASLIRNGVNTDDSVHDTIVLYKNPLHTKKFASNEYFIDIGMTVQSIEEIQKNYYALEHYLKPLKGISTYLKTDLEKIAEKTVFQEKPEMTIHSKQELYNAILMYLSESIE